jgi:hypothetical protein
VEERVYPKKMGQYIISIPGGISSSSPWSAYEWLAGNKFALHPPSLERQDLLQPKYN